jgi:hypothetical protein
MLAGRIISMCAWQQTAPQVTTPMVSKVNAYMPRGHQLNIPTHGPYLFGTSPRSSMKNNRTVNAIYIVSLPHLLCPLCGATSREAHSRQDEGPEMPKEYPSDDVDVSSNSRVNGWHQLTHMARGAFSYPLRSRLSPSSSLSAFLSCTCSIKLKRNSAGVISGSLMAGSTSWTRSSASSSLVSLAFPCAALGPFCFN